MSRSLHVGPEAGTLSLHTGRAGAASKAGHDLTLRVADWTGVATLDDAGALEGLRLTAVVRSLEVVRGDGGLKPLTDKDRATIISNALTTMKAASYPEVVYEVDAVTQDGTAIHLDGQVTIAGVRRPLAVDATVQRGAERVRLGATGSLTQSDFGLKPYSGMLGALRVRDLVEIRADVQVPLD